MDRVARIRILDSAARDRLADGWQRAEAQPNWIVRTALVLCMLVVVLPLLLVIGIVALVAILVLAGVALARSLFEKMRRLVRGDGRSNVRVIRRSGEHRADE